LNNISIMRIIRLLSAVGLLAVLGQYRPAWGGEARPSAFLHALQDQGYGDMAVDYLDMLKRNGDLTKELRETWDLEMGKSLRSAAADAYNSEESESLTRQAEKHLNAFLREKPDHPRAREAGAILAGFYLDRALKNLRAAQTGGDRKQNAELLDAARAALGEARTRFKQAEEKFQAELNAMPPSPKRPQKRTDRDSLTRREEIINGILNCRFQEALIDYYLAQTYPSRDAQCKMALQAAADGFDALFQGNRMETIGLVAHMWHGKATEELGDRQTALDIYDEVLSNEPEPGQAQIDPALQSLFSQVEHFRLQILVKQSRSKFLDEAEEWLQKYRKTQSSLTEGYQAISLDLAKTKLEASENASGAEKSKLVASALALLADISKIRSPYQQEAMSLRRQYVKSGGAGSAPASFEEAMALGEAAALGRQWPEAADNFGVALKLTDKGKISQQQRKEALDALVGALYMQARGQLTAGKWEDCLAAAEKIISDYKDSAIAPQAGSLAVSAALNLYAAAPEDKKTESLNRLKKYAKLVEDAWPGRPEADDARMMLAQAGLVQGKIDEALAGFDRIDPRSERYANALLLAAETYWRRRLAELEKPEHERNKGQMEADLDHALKNLETSLKLQRKKITPGERLPEALVETQLLLAEIKLGCGDAGEAAALLQSIIDAVAPDKTGDTDNNIVRVYAGAVRAYMALDKPEKALDIAMSLAEWGPDVPSVNAALVEVLKSLGAKQKQAQDTIASGAGGQNSPDADEAREKLKSITEVMNKLLTKMSSRKEFSAPATVYFADMCLAAGLPDVARDAYLRVAGRAEKDPAYAKSAGKALQRARAQLVDLLAKTGDYEEAYKQISQLAAANPRALDLLMTQGRILQSWSQRDPSRCAEAVAHWSRLRNVLQSTVKKPPEYFEITYNLAEALFGQASQSKDKTQAAEKAKLAEQLLKSTLVLSPNLSGPDMVEKFNALLKKIDALRQATKSR
jgi:hypothetical protein